MPEKRLGYYARQFGPASNLPRSGGCPVRTAVIYFCAMSWLSPGWGGSSVAVSSVSGW